MRSRRMSRFNLSSERAHKEKINKEKKKKKQGERRQTYFRERCHRARIAYASARVIVHELTATDDDGMLRVREAVHLVQVDVINLVDDVQTAEVDTVALDHVDELVHRDILPHEDLDVVHLVDVENVAHLVHVEMREVAAGRGDGHSSSLLLPQRHPRSPAVDPDAHGVELHGEELLLNLGLTGVKHHHNKVARARHADHLTTATLAFCGAFDDSGQIKQLDLGVFVLDHTCTPHK